MFLKIRICLFLAYISLCCDVFCQTRDPKFYSRVGEDWEWPNPGDPNYRTFHYNGRRYGEYQPNGYNRRPGGGSLGGDNLNTNQNTFPGVLGGWRTDLQGKQREDFLHNERDVFVKTNYGQIQGFKVYMYDTPDPKSFHYKSSVDRIKGQCSVFLGIPYAQPPTNEGRFKPPRPHRGWQLLQAVDYGPACPQPVKYTGATKGVRDMDEDCLYLNIYTPKSDAGAQKKYSVMLYIHGGNFIHGSSNLFQPHILASFFEIIVVTINYRLGALGFFSTADENSPGNYGILDQAMALRWVYENIEYFNGNKDSITVYGPGSGAASANLLMLAPKTKSMIKHVIAQSGSALTDSFFITDKYKAQNTSLVLGKMLGCSIESSWKLVNCLRKGRSFFELGNAEIKPEVGFTSWAPILNYDFKLPIDSWYEGWKQIDWEFLTKTPEQLLSEGDFNRGMHYMTGVTTQEASYLIWQNSSLSPSYNIDKQFFHQKIREHVFRYNYTLNPNGVYEAIKYMYTYWPDPENESIIRNEYVNMMSDFLYRAPVDKTVKLLLEKNIPVYMYVMNTSIEAFDYPDWKKYPHNIEHYLLSGAPFMDIEFFPSVDNLNRNIWTDNDRNMSYLFMKTFSNFIKTGNPTPEQVLGLNFPRAYKGELRYINLNTTYNSSILFNYRQTESAFWTQYLPTVISVLIATYPPTTEFWWEPSEPIQIAFWSMSVGCLLLTIIVIICCILWRSAKRQNDRFYEDDVYASSRDNNFIHDMNEVASTNIATSQNTDNVYQCKYIPSMKSSIKSNQTDTSSLTQKTGSLSSLKSAISLKETTNVTQNELKSIHDAAKFSEHKSLISNDARPNVDYRTGFKSVIEGIPQTTV